ncbi:NmrA family NAD(P)-binding protein [Isoptericola variabilis]|uniref:NmrA family NAD(P)-binding protein n=1 Tax=Isoptericola variabilis TaxID=139208 RepID=UPI0002D3EAEE|nr:NmrA family NAD(P)-binding protein [Isoptericola variabilis]TWH28405.1 NmrA-like family protein [Isoptericola variabilis J7]
MAVASGEVVAVVGATGRQGSAVVRHLLRDGWRVRALTRDPSGTAARTLHDLGAEVVRADTEAEVRQGRNVAGGGASRGAARRARRGRRP